MSAFETAVTELKRKGDSEKVKWLEGLDKRITPSQKKRIQENDMKVMEEIFVPKWVPWNLLYAWATKEQENSICIICSEKDSVGMTVKGKFICANCFIEIKHKN